MTTRFQRWLGAGFLIAASALFAGCGEDDDAADTEPGQRGSVVATPRDLSPVATYETWLSALESHDAEWACHLHAPEFTIELRQRAILEHRAELGDACVGFVALLWDDPAREYDPVKVDVTQVTSEDAELAVDFPGTDETASLQRRNGRWLIADITPRSSGTADSARWVESWCDLAVGMGRDQVVELMGAPSGEYTVADGGEPQLWWADRQYDFRAYLDLDGSVLDLVGDYDRLDAADRQILDCPELR